MVRSFLTESQLQYKADPFVFNTIRNVILGINKTTAHDVWMPSSSDWYCLCRMERDSDGEMVYTAYQLWLAPEIRSLAKVHRIIKFIRFYAQKQGYKRLYVLSSRLDKIQAYARGLGKQFKVTGVTFKEEF